MSARRKLMNEALKLHVIPVLRERGFAGTFPHFRRVRAGIVHLLTFCFSQTGGAFCVEVTACRLDNLVDTGGKPLPVAKANVWNVRPARIRLGAKDGASDQWFRFDETAIDAHLRTTTFYKRDGDPHRAAALAILPLLDTQAEKFWNELPFLDSTPKCGL